MQSNQGSERHALTAAVQHPLQFPLAENPWAPTAVVAEINERRGCGLEVVGLADQVGGVSSAAYVRWPDGRESALTRTKTSVKRMRQTADLVDLAYAAGLPVPRHELILELADGAVAVVQERLPGKHREHIDAAVIDTVVAMNERFALLLADRPDVHSPSAFPTAVRNPWEQTLGTYNDRTRRVLQRVREIDGGRLHAMSGDDLVHTDYSLGNILFDDCGRISGVIDWNFGADRGDRRFALLGMRTHLEHEGDGYHGYQEAQRRLDEILDRIIEPGLLRIYWAHRAAHALHVSIQDFPHRKDRIERDLQFAELHLA